MAKEIKTEILINATPEKVWSILTSFDNYPNWNPFIKSITVRSVDLKSSKRLWGPLKKRIS